MAPADRGGFIHFIGGGPVASEYIFFSRAIGDKIVKNIFGAAGKLFFTLSYKTLFKLDISPDLITTWGNRSWLQGSPIQT